MRNNINTVSYEEGASFLFFLAFLRQKIDQDRAKQINIARAIEVRPEYINRVYKGRQTCSVDMQERICRFFGVSYLEGLAIGRQLVQAGNIPSGRKRQPDSIPQPIVEKRRRITDRPGEEDIVAIVVRWERERKGKAVLLQKLQNIIENLREGIAILDANLIITYQNRAHREMFGPSLVGQTCYTAHGCDETVHYYPTLVSRQTGMAEDGFFPYANGIIAISTTPVRDMSGQLTGYVEVLRDITDREKMQILAKESLEMMDRAVVIYDEHLQIRLFNSKLKEITGAGDSDLTTTKKFLNYLQENSIFINHDEVVRKMAEASKNRQEVSIPVHFRNGKTFLLTSRPVDKGDVFLGRIGVFTPADGFEKKP
jgi:PAS domain-containing protein